MRLRIGQAVEGIADLRGRVEVYVEPRDLWVGAFVSEDAIYICPIPMMVVRISRGRSA
jgi:hypothetical protein